MDDTYRLMLLHSQPFRTDEAAGLISPDTLRGPAYQQLAHGVHQQSEARVDHGRRVQAFRRSHDEPFVLLGRSAAWALGARWANADDPVVVAIPTRHRLARTGTQVPVLTRLDGEEVVTTGLGPATCPSRTALDLARGVGGRRPPTSTRVAQVDALLRASGLRATSARSAAQGYRGLHGLPAARAVLALCRDGVDSPQETRLRLVLGRAGLPEPTTQCPVHLDGRVVARLDLGWPDLRVGCEYDGAQHLEPEQVRHDLWRHNRIRQAGWTVLQVDRHQIRRPEVVVQQLTRLLGP